MKTEGSPNDWLDQLPPWRAFPRMQPMEVAATQGLEEAWVDQVWRPFWAELSPDQRQTYLNHWGASQDWRDAIRIVFEIPADFDPVADAAESEAYLAQRRAEWEAQSRTRGLKGWLARLKVRLEQRR